MKKYYLTLISLVLCLILCGCKKSENLSFGSVDSEREDSRTEVQKKESIDTETIKNNQNEAIRLYANIDYKSNIINLVNLLEDEQVYKLKMEKGTYAESIYQNNGGYGIIVAHSKEGVSIKTIDKVSIVQFPYDISRRDYIIVDNKLKKKKTICLNDYINNQVLENLLRIVVSPDGKTIAFNTSEGLFLFDVDSKKCSRVFPLEDSNTACFLTEVIFVNNDVLAFTGITENLLNKGIADGESTGIGLINREGKILFEDIISDYPVSMLTTNADYVCFLDSIDPKTGSTRGGGKVKVLNAETFELKTILTSGNESALSRVSSDGKYLISAMCSEEQDYYQISSYNLQNGELENRVSEKFEKMKFIEIQTQDNGQAEIVYMTDERLGAIQFDVVKH